MTRSIRRLFLLVLAATLGPSLWAGGRVAPTGTSCPSALLSRAVDAAGEEDRCVSRTPPICKTGHELKIDAEGRADRCLSAKGGGADKPSCRPGAKLEEREGEDVCLQSERPTCPKGFSLKVAKGEDSCVP